MCGLEFKATVYLVQPNLETGGRLSPSGCTMRASIHNVLSSAFKCGPFCFVVKQMICQFACFPWVALCSHCRVHALTGLFLRPFLTGLYCGTASWREQNELIWCIKEVNCLIDIWADEPISNTALWAQQYIKMWDHIVHIDKLIFGIFCQAEHMKIYCWVGCVLAANKLLQGLNGIKILAQLFCSA